MQLRAVGRLLLAVGLVCLLQASSTLGRLGYQLERNTSDVAVALSEIINGLKPRQLAILATMPLQSSDNSDAAPASDVFDDVQAPHHIDDFIYRIHRLYYKSVVYYDVEMFFQHIEANLQGAIESVNLIFCKPFELSARIQERKLSHRLSLFIFYWGAKYPPKANEVRFEEPMRAVVITRPRQKAIYYNQAVPTGESNLRLVNWYDGDNLGLQKVPLLPSASAVYTNFRGRVFRVPVFHSPPWFWVSYNNDSANDYEATPTALEDYVDVHGGADDGDYNEVNVTGGRDHRLLCLLATHMNFQFVYIEAPGRTQGSQHGDSDTNESFTGGIGMLQNGLADFFLGDVGLSWERRKAIEFSFLTLADSGAFATHAPRRLNEALAIIRPFKLDIWPYLILTVLCTGPIFYAIIAIPYKWRNASHAGSQQHLDIEQLGTLGIHMAYIKEITRDSEATRRLIKKQNQGLPFGGVAATNVDLPALPKNLFDRCVWYTVQLFLKQSCHELYHGYRAKFLTIVYWIAATYVLADVYAAQLTSQFARPAHEPPINTLQRLQTAMLKEGYKLYVEKESSSLEMLENGTEIFRQLYALMKQQDKQQRAQQSPQQNADTEHEAGFLIDSVEAGIKLIADGHENKAVLGGRETLYFNIQQYGAKSFQLSQKLYTRYSAVAVQIGCPFLDSLNDVLIHLFEGGILDKMTTAEYEAQSRMITKELNEHTILSGSEQVHKTDDNSHSNSNNNNNNINNNNNNNNIIINNAANSEANNGKGAESAQSTQQQRQDTEMIQALNLRMLQGAFIVLLCGYGAAALMFMLEWLCQRITGPGTGTGTGTGIGAGTYYAQLCTHLRRRWCTLCRCVRRLARHWLVRILR